jgi:glycosyltransferase involved in cell wall biosynthesis
VPPFISVIIPNYNGEKTIGRCLDAAFASQYTNFEVVVVDDCSADSSTTIIEKYPCRLMRLSEHGGASKARNTGAQPMISNSSASSNPSTFIILKQKTPGTLTM